VQVLASSADSNAGASRSLVLAAFGAWLRMTEGRGLDGGLAQHPLVAAALAGLEDGSTFDAAVDAVSVKGRRGMPPAFAPRAAASARLAAARRPAPQPAAAPR
jgi:hypothetical protein